MDELLQVGVIASTHGIKGEVNVFPTTNDAKRFNTLKKVILDTGKEKRELEIQGVKYFKKFVILKFKTLCFFCVQIFWVIVRFFLLSTEISVLVFGLWAAHAYAADKAKGTLNKIGAAIDAGKATPDSKTAMVDLVALKGEMNEPERRLVKSIRKIRQKAVATGEPSPATAS